MIRIGEIEEIYKLVGLRQSTITADAILDADNLLSTSGLYVNDISRLITTANLKACVENKDISDEDFNNYLKELKKSSLVNLCNTVFSENDLLENRVLYNYENDFKHPIDNDVSFVGYEIDIAKRKDISIAINKIMLDFSGEEAVKVLLFHSSKNAVNKFETITTVKDSTEEKRVDFYLPAYDSISGGKWYIGYLRSGLTEKAYDRQFGLSNNQTCYNCFSINPIIVKGWDAETMFDVNNVEYSDKTWGMNFDISAYKDYTSLIIENQKRFAKAYNLQLAADFLNLIVTTTRSNQNERLIQAQALYELNGERNNDNIPISVGILKQLENEIKELKQIFVKAPKLQIETLR